MLAKLNVIGFYPSKFVLITDVLDTFGEYGNSLIVFAFLWPAGSKIKIFLNIPLNDNDLGLKNLFQTLFK